MSDTNKREESAFDALIVSQLRRKRDIMNLEDLPQLSEEELTAMHSIPEDIIETMWSEECSGTGPACEEHEEEGCALAGAGDSFNFGMDRSTKMEEEDKGTLDASRDEAREKIKKRIQQTKEKQND